MTKKTWTLTDRDRGTNLKEFSVGPEDVGGTGADWSVKKQVLHGGRSEGVEVIEIDNGRFRFTVIPTRGMGIWKGWIGEAMLGWRSPVSGPVHPQFVPVSEPSGLGWLDGFDELFVRCGLESNGAPEFDENHVLKYPLHGRIANLPAHRVDVTVDTDRGEISVTGQVDESRFHFQKIRLTATVTTRLKEPGFRIDDEMKNLSASPAEIQMLYHVNFGIPLLDGGAKLVLPAKTVVPRNAHAATGIDGWDAYQAEQPDFEEQVYLFDLLSDDDGNTQTLLKNSHATEGASLYFNTRQLPCFTQWKNTTSIADGYVTGIEPGTNYPNPRTFEGQQDRTVKLSGGETAKFDLGLAWHRTAAEVAAAERMIDALKGDQSPKVFGQPQEGWCAP